jgi:hypothetical protein
LLAQGEECESRGGREGLFGHAGVSTEPEVMFWHKPETGDDFGGQTGTTACSLIDAAYQAIDNICLTQVAWAAMVMR